MSATGRSSVVLVASCRLASVVSGIVVLALLLFYAVELRSPGRHWFGPLSDLGTVAWNVLLIVVVGGLRPVLGRSRRATAVVVATVVVTAAGAVASALLTMGALAFEVATPVSVAAVLVQSLWLHLLSRRLRGSTWSARLVRLGWWAPVAQAVGAVVVAGSLLLPWASTPQLVVMIAGIVIGFPAWAAWPVWFHFAGREISRYGVPQGRPDRPLPS